MKRHYLNKFRPLKEANVEKEFNMDLLERESKKLRAGKDRLRGLAKELVQRALKAQTCRLKS